MAKKKNESIADQISSLEEDLDEKSAQLKVYDKLLDKLLKEVFGMKRAEIDALISKKDTASIEEKSSEKRPEMKTEMPEADTETETTND